jgi:hypothetical protein
MAEFAVAAGVLATLLLCMPVLCRYHELQVASIEAARRVAFEGSWRESSVGRVDVGSLRHMLFPDTGDSAQVTAERVRAGLDVGSEPGLAGRSTRALLAPLRIAHVLSAGFDLREPELYSANVAVALSRPPQLPDPFAQVPIEFNERYVLLGGDWAASGPAQVAQRAGGLVLSRAAPPLRSVVQWTAQLLSVFEPALRELCLGQVDPERVPVDRLGQGVDPDADPLTRWSTSC